MRLVVVMAHEAVTKGQCLDFLAQSPLWSAESIGWRPYLEHPLDHIEINTRREVTPGDERQSYSKVIAQIGAEYPLGVVSGHSRTSASGQVPSFTAVAQKVRLLIKKQSFVQYATYRRF